jgi:glycosyltransferase involved in cell wall biosynthesis
MNILIANNRYHIGGGADRSAWETAKLLRRNGHQVIPFSMKNVKNWNSAYARYFVNDIDYSEIKPSFANLRTAIKMSYSFEAKRKIEALIKKTRPDVAHFHNIYGRLTPSILYSLKKYDVPVLMTLHDYKLICPAYAMYYKGKVCEKCKGGKFYRSVLIRCHKNSYLASFVYVLEAYVYHLLKTYLTHVTYFIAPSIFMKQKMVEFGIPQEKITYIPNFINFKTNHSPSPSFSQRRYFLYFGKLLRAKGILTLLEAVRRISNSSLLIAGDGDLRKEIQNFITKNGVVNVQILGHLDGDELTEVLAQSKFVVLPSECYENAPMAVLEAFAQQKPVVGARIGGIPELIDEGRDGLLFEPGNAVDLREKIRQMLSKSDAELKKMGELGREKVKRYFSAELHYERLINLYDSVLAK